MEEKPLDVNQLGEIVEALMNCAKKYNITIQCSKHGFVLRKYISADKGYEKWISATDLKHRNIATTWDTLAQEFLDEAKRMVEQEGTLQ